jgi:phosphoserine phosphatase
VSAFDPRLEGKRLYLMRHGKTYEPRLDAVMAGPDEDPRLPLTPEGRTAVEETARRMAHLRLDAAFSSTFVRSRETAGIVAEPHGIEVGLRSELEELRLHPPRGGDLREVARRYVALARALRERSPHEVTLDCGRSLGQVMDAAWSALHECLLSPGERVLVVAHGGVNRLLLARIAGMPPERFLSIDQDFACVNVIDFVRGGRPFLRALNATLDDPFKAD